MPLSTLIKTIQDIMRKDVGVDGDAQRISQIGWLIFLKIFGDKEKEWFELNPKYKSPIPSRFRWCNWAENAEGITGEELIDFINNELFPKLKGLATSAGADEKARVVGWRILERRQIYWNRRRSQVRENNKRLHQKSKPR